MTPGSLSNGGSMHQKQPPAKVAFAEPVLLAGEGLWASLSHGNTNTMQTARQGITRWTVDTDIRSSLDARITGNRNDRRESYGDRKQHWANPGYTDEKENIPREGRSWPPQKHFEPDVVPYVPNTKEQQKVSAFPHFRATGRDANRG